MNVVSVEGPFYSGVTAMQREHTWVCVEVTLKGRRRERGGTHEEQEETARALVLLPGALSSVFLSGHWWMSSRTWCVCKAGYSSILRKAGKLFVRKSMNAAGSMLKETA